MNFLQKYSNGWGHLIMSLAIIACCMIMLLFNADVAIHEFSLSIITLIVGYWFGSSATAIRPDKGNGGITVTPGPGPIAEQKPIMLQEPPKP
jgi:hypothetical protein